MLEATAGRVTAAGTPRLEKVSGMAPLASLLMVPSQEQSSGAHFPMSLWEMRLPADDPPAAAFPGRHLTPEGRVFNYRLTRARLVVELVFGILASRWRMYRRVMATSPEVAEICVKATCVLRHFLRAKKLQRWRRRRVEPDIDPSSAPEVLRDVPRMGSNNATRQALQIREAYCAHFNAEGAVAWQPRV